MATAALNYFTGTGVVPFYPGAKCQSVKLPASITYPKGQVLGELAGNAEVDTVTVTATGGSFKLLVNGVATANITYTAGTTAASVAAALNALSAGVQTVTLTNATGGTFTLSVGGQQTTPLAYNASAATVQAALVALPTVGAGNVTVAGSAGGPYTLTFAGNLATPNIPAVGYNAALLTGTSTPTIAVAILTPGGPNIAAVSGSAGGPYTVTFQGALGNTPVTLTSNAALLTGGANTAVVAQVTAGSAGTPGTFKAYTSAATDGSQVPKAVLEYDCATDSAGNITQGGASGGGPLFGTAFTSTPAYFQGCFATGDLVGLDSAGLAAAGWRLVPGSLGNGVVRLP